MAFIKTNRAEKFEPVKKDDEKVVKVGKVTKDKSLLSKVRATVRGR